MTPTSLEGVPVRCRAGAIGEPLAGTAPEADAWWLVHLPRPWGRAALADSAIPGAMDLAVTGRLGDGSTRRVLAVRRPGDARGDAPSSRVTAWIARPGRALMEATDATWTELAEWSSTAPPSDRLQSAGPDAPRFVVCTNGRRDACCAEEGRALIRALASSPGAWECSHIGGHRFAPTGIDLSTGYAYGRLGPDTVRRCLEGPFVDTASARGRTDLTPPEQAADLALRDELGCSDPDAIEVVGVQGAGSERASVALVDARDGSSWQVDISTIPGPDLAMSCGADPEPTRRHVASARRRRT